MENKINKNLISAMYFGFQPVEQASINKEDIKIAKSIINKDKEIDFKDFFALEELVALLRKYKEDEKNGINYSLICYSDNSKKVNKKSPSKNKEEITGLHLFDIDSSIGDALMIKTTENILKDNGYKKIFFKINDVGGKASQTQFNREAINYFRKHINELSADDRQLFKKSIFKLISESKNIETDLFLNAPKPMDFLGDETRNHFSEVLEYLEAMDINYEVSEFIIGNPNFSTHTVFEVIDQETKKTLAFGCRYNLLARKVGMRKDISAGGVFIRTKQTSTASPTLIKKFQEPKFFILQMGNLAKMAVLNVINNLKKANIVVKHLAYRDKISTQLGAFKKGRFSHSIIIGHKEALENTVTIKDAQGRSQKIIKQEDLVDYLKSL